MKNKYLTANDESRFGKFLEPHILRFLQAPDKPLSHYTTADNFIKIIEAGEMWATHISCLNDTKEMRYTFDEFRSRVIERVASNNDPELSPLLQELAQQLSDLGIEKAWLFVSCFSERSDDLSQWRAYGKGEGGIEIIFDSTKLKLGTSGGNPMLVKVDYNPISHKEILDAFLHEVETLFLNSEGRASAPSNEEWTKEIIRHVGLHLSYFAACLKHPAFRSEAEWRFVYTFGPGDVSKIKVLSRSSFISRHLALPLTLQLPITKVIIGPCRYPEITKIAVGDLLLKQGYDVAGIPIEPSSVPFRG